MKKTLVLIALFTTSLFAQYPDSVGRYTGKNWGQWIDTTWGQGIPTSDKLAFFDTFWNTVDQTWAGFPNLEANWDSLKAFFRPQVEAGVSRGRFAGIMSRLTRALNDWHVYATDMGIDSAYKFYSRTEYPLTSFEYKPGIPLFNSNELWFRSSFGAGVTALPDSTALVYSVMPDHPLGLMPGDLILGYNGIPWKLLVKELLDAELPILKGGAAFGSTPEAHQHLSIMTAGLNWGLFDTIDVFKYSTNDTLHFPTSLLASIKPPYHIATEQLPVNGVPFPDLAAKKFVSWGVVEGTNIGYIYAWDWYGVPFGNTKTLFGQAVTDLVLTKKVSGLILDFRPNFGGAPYAANDGYSELFNEDPTLNYMAADRVAGSDRLLFSHRPLPVTNYFTPSSFIYDRPIAVLTGPNCGSAGDHNALRLRFHPMTRFFGKRTNGTFGGNLSPDYTYAGSYGYALPWAAVYTDEDGYLIHKGNPVDEEIWLTQAGVANGTDDVVQRALEWIDTESYANSPAGRWRNDTLTLFLKVRNPMNHTIGITGKALGQGSVVLDSASFFNDGLHDDGAENDSVWGCYLVPGGTVASFGVSFADSTAGTSRNVSYKTLVTSAPLTETELPGDFALSQNYPNPFNPSTVIRFALPKEADVQIDIYNILGQKVERLLNKRLSAGFKQVTWTARVPSGVYLYRITVATVGGERYEQSKRMVLVR